MIYKSGPKSKFSVWNVVFGTCAPATFLTQMLSLPMDPTIQMAASIFFPLSSLYSYQMLRMRRNARQHDVTEAYLYESGDQLLIRTADGVLHKLDILFNDSHRLEENQDKSLIFVIENGDREYLINSKDAEMLDY